MKEEKKLIDIGSSQFFTDIEIIYWTVNGTLDGFQDMNPHQSTSGTKINDRQLPTKSRIALFILFGNYIYIRTNAQKKVGYFRFKFEILLFSNVNTHLFLLAS
jgi:hypothetical protein